MAQRPTMEELSAYLSGDMEEDARLAIEASLQSDPDVAADLQRLKTGLAFLKEHGSVQPPASLEHDILQAVQEEEGPIQLRSWRLAPIGATVLAAAAAVLFVTLPQSNSPDNRLQAVTEAEIWKEKKK